MLSTKLNSILDELANDVNKLYAGLYDNPHKPASTYTIGSASTWKQFRDIIKEVKQLEEQDTPMKDLKEVKLTNREIEVLKALKTLGYVWLARDYDEELYVFTLKPEHDYNRWLCHDDHYNFPIKHGKTLFNHVKLCDKEPAKIDDLLKGV